MLWNLSQRTFNGGQLDGRLMGRTDLTKYFQGASVLQNFVVKRQGCISRRPGTRILHTIEKDDFDSANHFRLIPFAYDLDLGYIIVMYASDDGRASCVVVDSAGATQADLDIPYVGRAIEELDCCQSGDTLFLAHRSYPLAKIIREESGSENFWSYREINFATLDYEHIPDPPKISSVTVSGFSGTGPKVRVEYCATAVSADSESKRSNVVAKTYKSPWTDGATMTVSFTDVPDEVEQINVFKRRNGRGWGFIGSVMLGPAKWYDEPVTDFTSPAPEFPLLDENMSAVIPFPQPESEVQNPEKWAPKDTSLFRTSKPSRTSSTSDANPNFSHVFATGRFRLSFADPVSFTSVHLGLGCWVIHKGSYYIGPTEFFWPRFIPCKASRIRAVFFFDNGTHVTVEKPVPASAQTAMDGGELSTLASAKTWLTQHAPDDWLDFDIYAVGDKVPTRKVASVEFTAFVDEHCTVIATGKINRSYPYKVTGSPLATCGLYITGLSEMTREGPASFVDDYIEPDQSVTPPKYEPFFDAPGRYPGCVTLYQQRLVLASTDEQPFTFWMSCVGDLYNFNTHDSMREDDALEVTLPALKYPDINHMAVNRDLILFCDNGEWIVSPIAGNAMTYATVSTKVESQIGGSKLHQPVIVGNDVLFVNAADETVVATKYDFTSDSYGTQDLSVLSHDVFRNNPITSIAYQRDPDSLVIVTLRDGSFATLTYMKEHEVVAWSVHRLANGAKALAVCTDGSMMDGATNAFLLDDHGHILRFTPVPEIATDPRQLAAIDCSTEIASGTTVPTGQIAVSPAGQVIGPGETAPAGSIVGIPFESRLVTVRPEPSPQETVQFEIKNPTHVDVRTHSASTFRIGQLGMPRDRDRTVTIAPPSQSNGKWTAPDADGSANIAGANGRDGRMVLTCDGPWPLTVLSIFTAYQVEKADQNPGRGE